jgi:hypothetical protein
MRRIAISAAVIGGVVIAARLLAPKLHARMLATCKAMFEHMPEDFPPKRMMGGIDEIHANTARVLELLEERTRTQPKPQEEPSWTTAEEEEVEMVPA